jgi:hypothetical protein
MAAGVADHKWTIYEIAALHHGKHGIHTANYRPMRLAP